MIQTGSANLALVRALAEELGTALALPDTAAPMPFFDSTFAEIFPLQKKILDDLAQRYIRNHFTEGQIDLATCTVIDQHMFYLLAIDEARFRSDRIDACLEKVISGNPQAYYAAAAVVLGQLSEFIKLHLGVEKVWNVSPNNAPAENPLQLSAVNFTENILHHLREKISNIIEGRPLRFPEVFSFCRSKKYLSGEFQIFAVASSSMFGFAADYLIAMVGFGLEINKFPPFGYGTALILPTILGLTLLLPWLKKLGRFHNIFKAYTRPKLSTLSFGERIQGFSCTVRRPLRRGKAKSPFYELVEIPKAFADFKEKISLFMTLDVFPPGYNEGNATRSAAPETATFFFGENSGEIFGAEVFGATYFSSRAERKFIDDLYLQSGAGAVLEG